LTAMGQGGIGIETELFIFARILTLQI
jgi:hypothetical protein